MTKINKKEPTKILDSGVSFLWTTARQRGAEDSDGDSCRWGGLPMRITIYVLVNLCYFLKGSQRF